MPVSHLHFGIKENGVWIDPKPYINADYPSKKKGANTVTIKLPVLKKDSKGAAVKSVQQLLNAKGYSCGTADGSFGSKTENALKKYQKATKLTVDGSCGAKTWTALITK